MTLSRLARLILFVSLAAAPYSLVSASGWPQFRGPAQNGVSELKGLPSQWSGKENIKWVADIPGRGWSSPIVWDDKVFVSSAVLKVADGEEVAHDHSHDNMNTNYEASLTDVFSWQLTCLDRKTGEVLWSRTPVEGHPRIKTHPGNTYASETPVTDGERVYVYFGMMGLFAYDFEGNLAWSKDFGAFPMENDFGTCSSPCYYDGRLFLQIDNEKESFLVSLNAKTGEEIWRVARDEKSNWSNPMIWENKERVELVTQGTIARSYDPATGKQLWELNMLGGRNSCTPAGDSERLFLANEKKGEGGYVFAVKAGASGDITPKDGEESTSGVAWYAPNAGIAMASPLVYEGYLYALDRRTGLVSCFNAETGDTAYFRSRLPGGKAFWASPWASDGRIYCLDEAGTTHVLAAGAEFNLLGQNKIEEKFWASAALAPGSVILRSAGHLYCINDES